MVRGVFVVALAVVLTGLVSFAALIAIFLFRWPAARVHIFPRWWGRVICRAAGVRVEINGLDKLNGDGPYIFAANHQSQFDIFAIQGYFPFDFRWLAKKELFEVPLFGHAMHRAENIPVDRAHSRQAVKSLDEAAQRIADGASVIIFPEGTRSQDGSMLPFKAGAMVLAIKARVPVVPVAITGSYAVMPKNCILPRSGRIRITIGAPIATSGYDLKQKHELAEFLQEKVAALMAGEVVRPPAPYKKV
ncbi:MAG: lysophospholipid acyltransferase family protein [Thermodesulfobacteriota bacterium]